MGYPMTWKRVINRNGLADGDYMSPPKKYAKRVNIGDLAGADDSDAFYRQMWPHIIERIKEYENSARMLAGDIRRLEEDTLDEQ